MEKSEKKQNYTRALTTSALMVALSMILSNIKLFDMPQGGAVTLFSMLPIILLGWMLGTRWGVMGGLVLGLINLMFDAYVIHPAQLILDYFLAFAVLGLSGLVRNKKHGLALGVIVGVLGRYICSFLSGWIFFGEYAPENFSAFTWSLWYNLTYIGTEGALTLILVCIPVVKNLFLRLRTSLES